MNMFRILFFDLIFILFPILVYIVFLAANNSISTKMKGLLFDILLLSSIYIVYQYNNDYVIINFLSLNSVVLIAYLKNRVISANLMAILLLIFYYNSFDLTIFMAVPYLFLFFFYNLKRSNKINEFIFIDLFLFTQYICLILWLLWFNNNLYLSVTLFNTIFIMIFNYIIIHIIYLLYNLGENIIRYNVNYNALKHDCQIKMSLFKITHEIKNPIAVIKAYLDMMNIKDKKQVEKYIPIIQNEINRLLNLLQDFLLVNKANVTFDLMDMNMLIEDVVNQQLPLFKDRKIKFENDLIDDEIYINGDYNRLSQVIINIIKNSIEAIDNSKNGIIKIKDSIKDNSLNIIIEDNGSGISKKNLLKIKEPFYTTKNRGTGLGVSLSDEIIKAHSGTLTYESIEGVGTKVIIKLPLYGKEGLC